MVCKGSSTRSKTGIQLPGPPVTHSMTFNEVLCLSVPQFPSPQKGRQDSAMYPCRSKDVMVVAAHCTVTLWDFSVQAVMDHGPSCPKAQALSS